MDTGREDLKRRLKRGNEGNCHAPRLAKEIDEFYNSMILILQGFQYA